MLFNAPKALAEAAPKVAIVGICVSYANLVWEANTVNVALAVFTIVYV